MTMLQYMRLTVHVDMLVALFDEMWRGGLVYNHPVDVCAKIYLSAPSVQSQVNQRLPGVLLDLKPRD